MAQYADPTVALLNQDKKLHLGSFIILLAGLLSITATGYLFWLKKNTDASTVRIQQETVQKNASLTQLKTVSDQLTSYDVLASNLHLALDTQKNWGEILDGLAAHLYKNIQLTSFQMDNKGLLTFTGLTTNYEEYAKLYNSLLSNDLAVYFRNVKPQAVTKIDPKAQAGSNSISFTFTASINPQFLTPLIVSTTSPAPISTP